MSGELTNRPPQVPSLLKITIHSRPGKAANIVPKTVTLTNSSLTVTWQCVDLRPGAKLEIHFSEEREPIGPLVRLDRLEPGKVMGSGNRGPDETRAKYVYEARIVGKNGKMRTIGLGHLKNEVTVKLPALIPNGVEPPPEPPKK